MSLAQALHEMERAREMLVLSTRLTCVQHLMETTGWHFEKRQKSWRFLWRSMNDTKKCAGMNPNCAGGWHV